MNKDNNKKPPEFLKAYLKWVDKLTDDVFSWFAPDHVFNNLRKLLEPIAKALIHVIAAMLLLSVLAMITNSLF